MFIEFYMHITKFTEIFFIFWVFPYHLTIEINPKSQPHCMTPGCVQTAAAIIKNMDTSVNPCQDFYKFACGGFVKRTVIPDDRTRMSSFSVLGDELLTQVGYPTGLFYLTKCGGSNYKLVCELV